MNHFHSKLKELRMDRGLTQAELGAKLAISPKVISKWENGESLPSCEVLPAIADVFDITMDALFDRVREDPVDVKSVVRKYGYRHAYSIPEIRDLFSYLVLGMQERDNADMGCYSEADLREISENLVSLIEQRDPRPQCHLTGEGYGIVNYFADGFGIGTMTCCEGDIFDRLIDANYSQMRVLFEVLSLEGADRLVKFFLQAGENISFTLEHLLRKTSTDEGVARRFLEVLLSMTKPTREAVLQKETAMLEGKETVIYHFTPYHEVNLLRTVLLSAVLLVKERWGYR